MPASSAGQTRGLIEACAGARSRTPAPSLPRVRPAASLKRLGSGRDNGASRYRWSSAGQTRGLIEAQAALHAPRIRPGSSAGQTRGLIEAVMLAIPYPVLDESSAGQTRGLIEAPAVVAESRQRRGRLPRVRPAASLKRTHRDRCSTCCSCLPRVRPAASLKLLTAAGHAPRTRQVFRGSDPRPH